jgi:hypothetical protein
MEEKQVAMSEVLQCFHFREKKGRGSLILEGERSTWSGPWFLHGGATRGYNDVVVTNSRSQAAPGLTQGARQLIGPIEPKGCLC